MTAITPHAVEIRDLDFTYANDGPALMEGLSLGIPKGAVTAVLGPNGSGKTTLLHLMVGILMPRAGRIILKGRPMEAYSPRELRQLIGLVPQEESVPFDLSVLEYVLLGRAPHLGLLQLPGEEDRRIAFEALESAGVADLRYRSVPSLSGGEGQLAAIARALAQETDILLLDEPTSHLDIANTRKVLEVLERLGKSGKTVLFTTHDPNAAATVGGFAVLLQGGRILSAGALREVFTPKILSRTYGVHIEVVEVHGRPVVLPFDFRGRENPI